MTKRNPRRQKEQQKHLVSLSQLLWSMKKTLVWVFVFPYFEKGVRGGWSWWDWLNSSQGVHSNEPGQHETAF